MKRYFTTFILVVSFFLIASPVSAGRAGAVSELETLGAAIYHDLNLSFNQNQACMTCHHPSAGFADPANRTSPALFPVSDGCIPTLFEGRNAPSAAYAGFSPIFYHDGQLFVGGVFWDGRESGVFLSRANLVLSRKGGVSDELRGDFSAC